MIRCAGRGEGATTAPARTRALRMPTLGQHFAGLLVLTLAVVVAVAGCGGAASDEADEGPGAGSQAALTQADYDVRAWLHEVGRSAQAWKRRQEGLRPTSPPSAFAAVENPSDFAGVTWEDVTRKKLLSSESQTYDGDRYVEEGRQEAEIVSRSPLVIEATAESGKVFRMEVTGFDAESIEITRRP